MSKGDLNSYTKHYLWMTNILGLKGLDKEIFAIIYGYTINNSLLTGSLEYLMSFTNSSKQAVLNSLKHLMGIDTITDKNGKSIRKKSKEYVCLIDKHKVPRGKNYCCEYVSKITAVDAKDIEIQYKALLKKQNKLGGKRSTNLTLDNNQYGQLSRPERSIKLTESGQLSGHNNILNNKDTTTTTMKKKTELYEKKVCEWFINNYGSSGVVDYDYIKILSKNLVSNAYPIEAINDFMDYTKKVTDSRKPKVSYWGYFTSLISKESVIIQFQNSILKDGFNETIEDSKSKESNRFVEPRNKTSFELAMEQLPEAIRNELEHEDALIKQRMIALSFEKKEDSIEEAKNELLKLYGKYFPQLSDEEILENI